MSAGTFLGAIAGGVMGLGQTALGAEIARRQSEADRSANYRYGEMAANNADKRTRLLYQDFYSPSALAKQYEEAGLSKSMMFGGTPGQGGMSGAQGSGASGPQTAFMPPSIVESALQAAQIANINAQTQKTKAETNTINGENKRGMAEIANILADTGAKEASTCYTQALATGQEISNKLADASYDYSLKKFKEDAEYMYWQARKSEYEANITQNEAVISEQTVQDAINIVKEQYKNLLADTALKWSGKRLNDQEVQESQQRMWKMIEDINIEWVNALANERYNEAYADWIEAKIPYVEKELELEAERIGIEEKRMWIDGVSKTVQGIGFSIMAASNAMNRGRQGETTGVPPLRTPSGQKVPTKYITLPKYKGHYGRR